ncbi:MAG: DUF3540 domain-containing protein [Candidatus Adiutrix sp.]|jgi:hypothetical protein|nr:DUF3540 domain-containing protein [Candidatus Adiutrix sp.]
MTEAALKLDEHFSGDFRSAVARVTGLGADGGYMVLDDGRILSASPAASCPLRPEPGDEVALLRLTDGRTFIIAVLRRFSAEPQSWSIPEGLTVDVGERAEVLGRGALGFTAVSMRATAEELDIQAERLKLVGGLVDLLARGWRFFGRSLFSNLESVTQHIGRSSRLVRDHDETRAGSIVSQAQTTHITQAEQVVTTAGEAVRIDGKQINLA